MPCADTPTIVLTLRDPPPLPAAATRHTCRRARTTLSGGVQVGTWRVERELGRGGMATVYEVVHTRHGKRAALKLAHHRTRGRRLSSAAFLREARAVNRIAHSGVAEVFATGTHDGRPYLAMELLSGRSLGDRLDDPLTRGEGLEILLELCDVLAAAHAAGVIHRDLKLDNVLVLDRPRPGDRRTKLLDWGMARITGEDDPLHGFVAGTLTYVAPEQLRGDDITPAADVYALAVLAYRLLLGSPPFAASRDLEILRQHLHAQPPPPSTLWRAIPPELETTLLAMLAKQPEDRPALGDIVRVLRAARDQLAASEPAPPADPGRPSRGWLTPRQQRLAAAGLGLALTIASLLRFL